MASSQDHPGGGHQAARTGRPATSARTPRPVPTNAGRSPVASSAGVRSRMQAQRTRDTAPELALRRALHAMGLRYRVDRAPLPGMRRRADIVFGPTKVAVYVDGCFWHACPTHGRLPRANAEWWQAKLQRTTERDRDNDARLAASGWQVVRVWEHQDPAEAAASIGAVVAARRGGLC